MMAGFLRSFTLDKALLKQQGYLSVIQTYAEFAQIII